MLGVLPVSENAVPLVAPDPMSPDGSAKSTVRQKIEMLQALA